MGFEPTTVGLEVRRSIRTELRALETSFVGRVEKLSGSRLTASEPGERADRGATNGRDDSFGAGFARGASGNEVKRSKRCVSKAIGIDPEDLTTDRVYPRRMRVIGTVGLPGSGKGEAAAVARESGIPVVTMGDVIRRDCRERGHDPADHHGEVARALREEEGPLAIAERSLPLIEEALEGDEVVLVDGLRSGAEAKRFERAFDEAFSLVAVEAPFEVRETRLGTRGRDNPETESLETRDERELGFGMGEAIDRADVTIENTDSLDAFRERIRALLTEKRGEIER